MNMIKNYLCAANGVMIFCYILDVILILAAIGLFVWYSMKNSRTAQGSKKKADPAQTDVEKINDDTYVIAKDEEVEPVVEEPIQQDNAVEHFSNQLAGINEPVASELKSTAVIVNHEVEQPVKKVVKKEEINNFVMIDGVKKEKTESEKEQSFNRGTNAFKNSTNFLNTIKEASNEEEKKTAQPKKTTKK
ncbi:MAG: hypothetical protein IKD36_03285 [Clostridia bacterium]|nr:hypothetical protein [Clostridia bacterium]